MVSLVSISEFISINTVMFSYKFLDISKIMTYVVRFKFFLLDKYRLIQYHCKPKIYIKIYIENRAMAI
jgi:hypothetical protein